MAHSHDGSRHHAWSRLILRYGLAVLLPALVSLSWLLSANRVDATPFLLLCAVCAISAWYGGLGPGFLSILVGVLATLVLYHAAPAEPAYDLDEFGLQLIVFALITMLIIWLHVARRRAEQALLHQAFHDAMTGLPNRRLFSDRLEQLLAAAHRTGRPFAVLLLDLDGFKQVNDALGHLQGDRLLIQVAQRLGASVRASDTVARWGGDEFALLLPETDERGAAIMTSKLGRLLARPQVLNRQEVVVTASVGVAVYPGDGTSAGDLLAHADGGLYRIKARTHNPTNHHRC